MNDKVAVELMSNQSKLNTKDTFAASLMRDKLKTAKDQFSYVHYTESHLNENVPDQTSRTNLHTFSKDDGRDRVIRNDPVDLNTIRLEKTGVWKRA